MAEVTFWAKPGCKGNARQMEVLKASGHTLAVRDLLTERWTAERLAGFFDGLPPADWFNRSAVRVKSGEVVPDALDAREAMALLLADPALIRRPLMEVAGERRVGWEPDEVAAWIGLGDAMSPGGEGCLRGGHKPEDVCTPPAADA